MKKPLSLSLLAYLFMAMPGQASHCELKGKEYIRNADFSRVHAQGTPVHWGSSQHSNSHSFETELTDDEFTIRKVGSEPWYIFTQNIDGAPLAGKVVVYSAELKLDLRRPQRSGTRRNGGGLRLMAQKRSPNTGMYRNLLGSTLDHEPRMGQTDWQKVEIVVKVPVKTERLSVGFVHQADGVMQVRKPSLRRANLAAAPCPRTTLSDP
jgi:hypothetical protein